MPKQKIYLLTSTIERGGTPRTERRLVCAPNQAAAIRHVIETTITCELASQQDLVECTKAGVEVETVAAG